MRIRNISVVFVLLAISWVLMGQDGSSQAPMNHSVATTVSSTAKAHEWLELTPNSNGQLSQDQIRRLMKEVGDRDLENDKKRKDYTYIQREEQYTLDGKGRVKKTEIRTSEVLMIYGEQVERLIAKDDRPLSEKDSAKEDGRIQKIIDKRKNESEVDRQKRLNKQEQEREEDRRFASEISDAYNFRLVGSKS